MAVQGNPAVGSLYMTWFGRLTLLLACIASPFGAIAHADAYDAKPKLVIILVFDQFRGDYLDRYRSHFTAKNGWNLFLKQGAHFTDCYYDYANLVTAAGHATIGTGAYTDGHGIPLNDWWERGPDGILRLVSSVEDRRFKIIGAPTGADTTGASPAREMATTVGDELVLATRGQARVYGVSLKDRAAIMTSGHATNGAFWIDHDSGTWVTSTYWMNDLPKWVKDFNASSRAHDARVASGQLTGSFYELVGKSAASVKYELDFAEKLISEEKLGKNPAGVTDLITISVSSTDINGHAVGPDDLSQEKLIEQSDTLLDHFFTDLDKTVGLKNVVVALSGDHGVAITHKEGDTERLAVTDFTPELFTAPLEAALEKKWSLKEKEPYVLKMDNPYLLLNRQAFEAAHVSEEEAENTTRSLLEQVFDEVFKESSTASPSRLRQRAFLTHVYTTKEMREGRLPDTQYGRLIAHSYSPYVGWALHINFGPYQLPWKASGTTHFTANSYDRHVPLDFYGAPFVAGTYHGLVAPVDIAATLASLLRINRPSAAVGRVLTEALRPEPAESASGAADSNRPGRAANRH